MRKSTSNVADSDRYLNHLIYQTNNLDINDSKHIEIDSQYSIFIIKTNVEHYTGWIYFQDGEIPAMTFRNLTLKEIVALAYEDGIFTGMVGDSAYNESMVQELEKEIDSNSIAEVAPSLESQTEANKIEVIRFLKEIVDKFSPTAAEIRISDNAAYIALAKSLIEQKRSKNMEKNNDLIKSGYQLWPTVDTENKYGHNLDAEVETFFKSQSETLEKSTKIESTDDELKKSKIEESMDQNFTEFDHMTHTQKLQALVLKSQINDPIVGLLK